jgi:hypothetical protein
VFIKSDAYIAAVPSVYKAYFFKGGVRGSILNLFFTLFKGFKLVWVKNKVFAGPFMR